MVKILFLRSNARNTTRLDLDVEVRDIQDELAKTDAGGRFRIEDKPAVRPEDLQRHLLGHRPDVVHFSGHGSRTGDAARAAGATPTRGHGRNLVPQEDAEEAPGGLLFQDHQGVAVAVRPEALAELVAIVRRDVTLRCVVLNACFTLSQARDIAQHVDCVVGMRCEIDDRAAVAFAAGFYRALALGKSVQTAFDLGRNEIALRGLPDEDVPELVHRPGVKPHDITLHGGPSLARRLRAPLRRAAPAALLVLCALAAAALLLPPVWVPAAPPEGSVVVVAGPWLASSEARDARRALCDALDRERQDGEPKAACLALPRLGAGDARLREQARTAGASLLVLVDGEASATIHPLGRLEGDEMFHDGLPRVDLSDPASAAPLSELLRSLAQLAQMAEDPTRRQPERLRCTPIEPDAPRSIALLALLTGMYAPDCRQSGLDPRKLLGSCRSARPADEACRLVEYLHARVFPSSPGADRLPQVLGGASEPVRSVAVLRDARAACSNGHFDEAKQGARRLWESPDACVRVTASIVAACLLSEEPGGDPAERSWLGVVEGFADRDEVKACMAREGWRVLAERAWWRAQGERWQDAAADYRRAWEMSLDRAQLLNLVAVLLHQGQTAEALQRLRDARGDASLEPEQRVHEALLAWIAERRGGSATGIDLAAGELLDVYRRFPLGRRVFEDASDEVVRPLACPDGAAVCAWEILLAPKTSISEQKLEQALALAQPVKGSAAQP